MDKIVELSVKDFRMIKHANIRLDGISVVSGINGCGKSTISKLFYYIFRNANSFDELVLADTNEKIEKYLNALDQIQSFLLRHGDLRGRIERHRFSFPRLKLSDLDDSHEYLDLIKRRCNQFIELESRQQSNSDSIITDRIHLILALTMDMRVKKGEESRDVRRILDNLLGQISDHLEKAQKLRAERPYKLLKDSLDSAFDSDLPKTIVLKEYGDPIVQDGIANVPLLHYIKKIAYIDTPMVIGMETSSFQPIYWKELNQLLKYPPRRGYKRSINDIIKKEILKGDVSFDDDYLTGGFKYKREDGKEFDLLECATGIKSFSLLQLLLKNLFLGEDTLLVIDEPEAHLHPQWIVEYARLIVLLHKKVGVKFFIASHSTDMVSAIRYIAEKEKCLKSLSFYVAERKAPEEDLFTYRSLGHDIEPIFESFNKSFEKLDLYVSKKAD